MAKKRATDPTTEDYRPLTYAFEALCDPTRLHILALLSDGLQRTVGTIIAELVAANGGRGLTQPTVSHHLRILHGQSLVRREKRGQFVWYGEAPEEVLALAGEISQFALTVPV